MEQKKNPKKTKTSKNLSKPLPDGRVNLEKHFTVFKYMFTNGNKLLSAKEVGPNIKINNTMVSGVFGFFYKIGLLNREKNKYSLKKEFNEAIKSLVWDKKKDAKKLLKNIYLNCWFGSFIQEKANRTPEISKENLMRDIGFECGAEPLYHGKAILRLVEFMEDAELIIYSSEKKSYSFNLENNSEKIQMSNVNRETFEIFDEKENTETKNDYDVSNYNVTNQDYYKITISGFGKTDVYSIEEVEDIEIIKVVLKKLERKLSQVETTHE